MSALEEYPLFTLSVSVILEAAHEVPTICHTTIQLQREMHTKIWPL